jgi:hypothetical protein
MSVSLSQDQFTNILLWFPGSDWVSVIPVPSFDTYPAMERRVITHTLINNKTSKIAYARACIEYQSRIRITITYKNCSLNRENGIVPGVMDLGLMDKRNNVIGRFYDKDSNEEGFYYNVNSAFLSQEPIEVEYKWCDHCNDELPVNHTCVPCDQ